jgi:succinate dehydrogenase / fumarate reductase cytochrome b subunit
MYKSTGFISWLLRRISGVALVLYLFMHLWVIGAANSGVDTFNSRLDAVQTPLFKVLEVALLAAVVYHGLDGIRLLLIHYFDLTEYRKSMFWAVFILSAILTLIGGGAILLIMANGG